MTYLMYAVNPEAMRNRPILDGSNLLAAEEGALEKVRDTIHRPTNGLTSSTAPSTVSDITRGQALSETGQDESEGVYVASPWVPVVKCVLEFAKQRLWMPEVRR